MQRLRILLVVGLSIIVAALLVARHRRQTQGSNVTGSAAGQDNASSSPEAARARAGGGGRSPGAAAVPATPVAVAGKVVVSGKWGSQPGQFGRRADPESNPEGPMAIVAGARGEIDVVDQINRRVQRFRDGKPVGAISLGGDTVQDAAAGKDGRLLLLDRLADRNVQVYGADGKLQNELSLQGKGVPEGGAVTGVFANDDGVYVERGHDELVRIADASGAPDPDRPTLAGRPTRDGHLLLKAQLTDRAHGELVLQAFDRATGQPQWSQPVSLGAMILHIITVDSDRAGEAFLAADLGRESPSPPYQILDERVVILRFAPGGTPSGSITVPPFGSADETFRPITVDDDGTVLVMTSGPQGLTVTRYQFP
jgi:hypothetical protein